MNWRVACGAVFDAFGFCCGAMPDFTCKTIARCGFCYAFFLLLLCIWYIYYMYVYYIKCATKPSVRDLFVVWAPI